MSVSNVLAAPLIKCSNPACASGESATKRCGKCKHAMYCGQQCQIADWTKHKVYCVVPAAAAIAPSNAANAANVANPVNPDFKQNLGKSTKKGNFFSMCIADGSSDALSEARKYGKLGQMSEAATFVSLMAASDQDIFLSEMANCPGWKTVDVAILLAKSDRMKEAMAIMAGFPSGSERDRFLKVAMPIHEYLKRYSDVTMFSTIAKK